MQTQINKILEEFLEAVNLLFHSNEKDMKIKANQYLIDFEKRKESWDVAFQVLQKQNLPEEAYYNALNILKRKIKYDFGNFLENPEYIEKLLSFFEINIDKFKKFKLYILRNYCDCIGKAFLFTGDKFKIFLQKFTNKLYGENIEIESLMSLLLIFNNIDEAGNDKQIVIDEKSRENIKEKIKMISGDVFQFIITMINKLKTIEDKNLKNFISDLILDTINNYLYIDLDEEIFIKFNNEYLPIINFIFQIDEENLEKHSDCICNLLNFPLQNKNMSVLAQIVFGKISQFKEMFYKTIESLDNEQTSFYIEVFTSMAKQNLEEIFKEQRYDFIQIIVDLTKNCPVTRIDVIEDFFIEFNDYSYHQKIYSFETIKKTFKKMIIQLILNIINLTKFEDQIFSKLNVSKTKVLNSDDDYKTTLDFRESAKEILQDFLQYYQFSFFFEEIIFPEFNKIIVKIKENQKEIIYWCKLENLLYIFSCLIKYIDIQNEPLENVIIFLYTIFDIPKEFIQITRIATDIIDICSDNILLNNKDLLFKCFKYLINGLENNLIIKYCSVTGKELLIKNKEIMSTSEIKEDLMNLYEQKLKNQIIDNDKLLYIVEGIVTVVSYSNKNNNSYEKIKSILLKIINPWAVYLLNAKKLLENYTILSPDNCQNLIKILLILKEISRAAIDGLYEENIKIIYEILNEIWPIITFILNKLSTNSDIVENIIQLIKIYMRGLKDNFLKFIPEYVNLIINGYKLSPISSYLYGFEILVTVFPMRKEEEIKSVLNNTFSTLCSITLNNYIKKSFDLNIFVQIGEDFFGMLYRIMKISPIVLFESGILDDLINTSLNYINTKQIQIAKNIMEFLDFIIRFENSKMFAQLQKEDNFYAEKYKKQVQNLISKFSYLLCEKILELYIDCSLEQITEEVTHLFIDFIVNQKPLVLTGIKKHLENFPSDILTNKEKNVFIDLIDEYSIKKEDFNDFIDNLINRCYSKQYRNQEPLKN